ncbi:MAG: YIP1 family protein [Candidatus Micrarchaeia archaeon]
MLKFKERTDSWNSMMLSPGKTSEEHAKKKELGFSDGLKNFCTPILAIYLPLALLVLALSGNFSTDYLAALLLSLAATALGIIAVSFAFTFMAHGMAKLLGGKAAVGRLYYMVSLAAAPTFIFTIVINIAVILLKSIIELLFFSLAAASVLQLAGDAVAVAVTVYGFYLLTLSIGALYKFGMKKAVAAWLVPTIALLAVGALLFSTVLLGVLKFLIKAL